MSAFTATFLVSSESSEKLRHAQQFLAAKARPDDVLVEVARSGELKSESQYRLGDYFSSIQVADGGPTSFRLVFVTRPFADHYWKDLAVSIVASIKESAGVSVHYEHNQGR